MRKLFNHIADLYEEYKLFILLGLATGAAAVVWLLKMGLLFKIFGLLSAS